MTILTHMHTIHISRSPRTFLSPLAIGLSVASLFLLPLSLHAAETKAPLKALFVTGGGYHDYKKLAPFLTSNLAQIVNVTFDVKFGLEALRDPKFADNYDAVVYDMCDDEAPDEVLENALQATRKGKPAVLIHCAVHAFRRSPKIREWETCCGMRSKVHDPFGPFTVTKLDKKAPSRNNFQTTGKPRATNFTKPSRSTHSRTNS